MNATQAAVRAGYSKKTARAIGSTLLTKVYISEYLQKKREETSIKLDIAREVVLAEYIKLAFFDIRKVYTESGTLIPLTELGDNEAAAIAGIEFEIGIGGQRELRKIKLSDKRASLDSICKMQGYNDPEKPLRIELNLSVNDIKRISQALENEC